MPLVVPDVGERYLMDMLRSLFNGLANPVDMPIRLRLYTNDHQPGALDTVAAYTQLVASGYAPPAVNAWQPSTTAAGEAVLRHSVLTLNFTVTNLTVYGYYMTNQAGNAILWAERFSIPVPCNGPTVVNVEPNLGGASRF